MRGTSNQLLTHDDVTKVPLTLNAMKTHMKPKFRQWCEYSMLKLVDRNSSVVRNWQ